MAKHLAKMGDDMIDALMVWAQSPQANIAVLIAGAGLFCIGAWTSSKTVLWGDMFAEEWDD